MKEKISTLQGYTGQSQGRILGNLSNSPEIYLNVGNTSFSTIPLILIPVL